MTKQKITKGDLLASAPSLKAIEDCIAQFFCDERKMLVESVAGRLWHVSQLDSRPIVGVQVRKDKGRYRFEMVR